MLSVSSSFISKYCPPWTFVTSLAGNGGKVEESFTPNGSIPVLSLGYGVSIINVEGVDGRGSAVLGTMLVLSDAGSGLRDTCGMVATETMADAGGRRPRAGGRTRGGGAINKYAK